MTIIPLSDQSLQDRNWQWHLQNACRSGDDLAHALDIELEAHENKFPLLVPWPFISRMERGNPRDPLLLQVLSRPIEDEVSPNYVTDPLDEFSYSNTQGLVQKYQHRVLIVTTGACAVNCRYCFRRHFPYAEFQPSREDWQKIIQQIAQDSAIKEVILSGGDPLTLSDKYLKTIIDTIASIAHVDTIRFHTRLPIVIPQRVTNELIEIIKSTEKKIVIVVHSNHGNEIDASVVDTLSKLKTAGVVLLNQSVLLRGINDSSVILTELSRKLFHAGVLPYYLHALDSVKGAAHFDITEDVAKKLIQACSAELPGYLVPKLVREVPGTTSKQPL